MAAAGFGGLQQLGNQSIGQSIGYGISKAQAGDAFNLWKKSLKRGPKYAAIGLERAGINRILAGGGGVTAAAPMQKLNQASGSPGSGKPGVETATARALSAQAGAADAQATFAGTQNSIAELQRVEDQWRANFYNTAEGQDLLKAGEYKRHLPDTITGAGIRGTSKAIDLFLDNYNNPDPRATTEPEGRSIIPRNNRSSRRDQSGNLR